MRLAPWQMQMVSYLADRRLLDVLEFGGRHSRMLRWTGADHVEPQQREQNADGADAVERPLPAGRFDDQAAQRPGEHGADVGAVHRQHKAALLGGWCPFGDEIVDGRYGAALNEENIGNIDFFF